MALAPDLTFGMIVPVLTGTIAWGFGFPFYAKDRRYLWLLPLGVILPFILGIVFLREIPALPPVNTDGWLFYFGCLALIVGFIPPQKLSRESTCAALAIASGVLVGVVNVAPLYLSEAFPFTRAVTNVSVISALACLFVWLLLRVGWNGVRMYVWLCMLLTVAASVLLIVSGSAYLGLLVGTLGAAFGPGVFLSLTLRRDVVITSPLMLGVGLLLAASVAQGYLYAEMPLESAVLFAATPGIAARGGSGNRGLVAAACFAGLAILLASVRYFGFSLASMN